MEKLVLRSEVVSLEAMTVQIQNELGIDIYEAADIVYEVLRTHESSIQFWKLPIKGLPYQDDEPHFDPRYADNFLESRWWDKESRLRMDAICKEFGKTDKAMERIEGLALLRVDIERLFAGALGKLTNARTKNDIAPENMNIDIPDTKRELAESMPTSTTDPVNAHCRNEIDPCDLPTELDAANMAFRAVSNGYGDMSATFRNRLVSYLGTNFKNLKNDAIQRIATVANPDKSTGRKKRDSE